MCVCVCVTDRNNLQVLLNFCLQMQIRGSVECSICVADRSNLQVLLNVLCVTDRSNLQVLLNVLYVL